MTSINKTRVPAALTLTEVRQALQARDKSLDVHTHVAADVLDFTEAAQDAIGAALVDTATINLEYNDGTPSITGEVIDDSIIFAKMQNIATDRLIGRDTASTGDPEQISVGGGLEFTGSAGIQRSALTGDVEASAGSNTTLIPNDTVTYAKMQNISATDRLLGRDTTGAGDTEELTVGGGVEFTGAGGIQRSALTGDVTASAGSNATTIPNDTVTYAKMQNISATDRILGRDSASAGDTEELTVTGGVEFTGSGGIQRSALTGDVTASAGSNATTIANDAVSNAKAANMAESTIKGRAVGAGTGDPTDLTGAQAGAIIKLDDLATPDDNTDLNASTSRHGLLQKLDNVATNYLDGTGAWSEPPGGGISTPTGEALPSGKIWLGSAGNVAAEITPSGDVTMSNTGVTAIGANKVTYGMIAQGFGGSVLGRAAATAGDNADIVASNEGNYLVCLTGGGLGWRNFDNLDTAAIVGADYIPFSDDSDATKSNRKVTLTNLFGQRPALTGDVTASLGSYATTVIAASDTVAGKIEIAVQSEMETGTDTTRAVTPGRQQYHQSAAKFWTQFDGTNPASNTSYNVTSIADVGGGGAGYYEITIATDFSSAAYVVLPSFRETSSANVFACKVFSTPTEGVFRTIHYNAAGTQNDPTVAMSAGFGDHS